MTFSMKIDILRAQNLNFIYLISFGSDCICIDPSEAPVVIEFCQNNQLILKEIWNTHHHLDHVGGNLELKNKYQCKILAPSIDQSRYPGVDVAFNESHIFAGHNFKILKLAGHTYDHVAIYHENTGDLFVGDVLFNLGCGRIFDGTMEQMFESLQILKTFHPQTKIYCAHDYFQKNLEFSQTIENSVITTIDNVMPFKLVDQIQSNLFLKTNQLSEFIKLRQLRNQF